MQMRCLNVEFLLYMYRRKTGVENMKIVFTNSRTGMENGKIVFTNRKLFIIVGIIIFGTLIVWRCKAHFRMLFDIQSLVIVIIGGCALAFIKMPKNINYFLKYFSKTSLLCGVLNAIIECINALSYLDFGSPSWIMLLGNALSIFFVSIFYGLIFSGISYALYREESH